MVRLAFAVRPPPEVLAVVASLPRAPLEHVVWSRPEQWIVRLRPLGHVAVHQSRQLVDAVAAELDGAPPMPVCLGPATRRLAGQWLGAPVTGLDELAAGVFAATERLVPVTHPQPFHADLVLARGRVPAELAGQAVRAEWTVTEVLLVADRSSPHGPRMEDVGSIALEG